MKIIQQQSFFVSSILLSCFLGAMERDVPQVSTAVTVVQEEFPPNPLLKEFFVKSGLQENFDQAQFYKSHPDMFGAKTDIPKVLPNLIPDVCKAVLSHLGPDYRYTKTALGLAGLSSADKYCIWYVEDQMMFCETLHNLSLVKISPEDEDVLSMSINGDIEFQFNVQICMNFKKQVYKAYDYYSGRYNTYKFEHFPMSCEPGEFTDQRFDGLNRYGHFVLLQNYSKKHIIDYRFVILNIEDVSKKYMSDHYAGKVTAFGLHYASNRIGICSFDNETDTANIWIYDFNAALSSKNDNQLVTWQGKLPEKFRKCIFVTGSTLLGITQDGKLYSMALQNNKTISVHRQVLKDLNKKDLLIKQIAVDFMDPRRVVFVATEQENLYLMDLKSEKNSFVKIQDKIFKDSVGDLYCGDGKIGIKVKYKYYKFAEIYIQNFDYIPH